MLNIAIIGLGRIGSLHYKNIKQLKNKYNIKYLFDINQDLEKEYKERIFHPDLLSDQLTQDKLDAVIICSPTDHHYQQIMTSLKNNVHVFVEKPISLSEKEIESCFDEAKKQDLRLLVGFNRRFDPKIRELKKRYHRGEIKDLQQVLIISRDYPYPNKRFIETSGGIFHDCIIHDLDNLCWILGEYPYKVISSGNITSKTGKETGHLDNVTSILEFKSGIMATLISSRIGNSYDQRIEFMGSSKSIRVNNDDIINPISFPERYHLSYLNEITDFYDIVVNNNYNDSIPTKNQCVLINSLTNTLEESFNQSKSLEFKINS